MLRIPHMLLVASLAGCATDPCGGFGGQTCIAVEVRGGVTVDQFLVSTSGAFTVRDAPTPRDARLEPISLPIAFALLPGNSSGDFGVVVRARRGGADVATGAGAGVATPGEVTRVTVDLSGSDGGVDFGFDFARPIDLRGADLTGVACNVNTQAPCGVGEKCVFIDGASVCRADGSRMVAQSCNIPDDCVRSTQCLAPGDPTAGVCEQFCAMDPDCKQAPVGVGGTALPDNSPHCLFNIAGGGSPKICSLACNPVGLRGASGCPTGAVCVYAGNASIPEFTFCDRAGTGTDGQPCNASFRCAPGFNCVQVGADTRCRAVCRASTNADCSGGQLCASGIGGNPPMFGFCCPGAGC